MALKHPWIGWAYLSIHTTHSWGVSILIAKSTHFELRGSGVDPLGRYVFLYAAIYGEPIPLLALYVPSPFNSIILTNGFSFMALYPSVPAAWLGDFNMTLDPSLDKLHPTPPAQPLT